MATAEGRLPSYTIANLPPEEVYDDGYLLIEHQNYYLSCGGQPIYLPRTEFLLISRLARSIDRVVTAEELWRAAWGDAKPLNYGALRVYIYRLRNRLLPYRLQIDVLVNVGYRLLAPPRE
ncbi:MAG TPA: helix-turn-helix domain-containing protein [Pyrinomonadaceae bacterium]|jgi:DNA-binding response OmpR family regulator